MITYISSKNADKYRILFDKAADALKANPPEGMTLEEDFAISSLNEYFAYLEDLVKTSNDVDISRFFVRLPLDEDFFEINANTRAITIPNTSFGRYGVGVQGDELAEVVYFRIDRYFDSMDLASSKINIAIQWEAKDANKNIIAGISKNFGKDIETDPGHIIFGWPISSELTKCPGTVKFAVRFYQLGEGDTEGTNKLIYSFSTLPAEVSINASLDYDLVNNPMQPIDHGNIITGRIKNVGVYDPSVPTPEKPIITVPLYVMSPEGNELVKIVDLPSDPDGVVKLAISAKPADIGVISYDWNKFAYNSASGSYESNAAGITAGTEFLEVPYTESLSVEKEYYTVSFDAEDRVVSSSLISSDRIANIEPDTEEQSFMENGSKIKLYKKLSVASVNTVGEYSVDVIARARVNTSDVKMDKADRIRIPGPLKPEIILPEETATLNVTPDDKGIHIIADNGTVTLKVNAVEGEKDKLESEVGKNPQVALSYRWKRISSDGVATDLTENTASMPVSVLPTAQLPDDPAWLENAEEDGVPGAKGIFNQEHSTIIQNGTVVTVYIDEELKTFDSTQGQGEHAWLALDVDTGLDTIVGSTWNDSYTFVEGDENELGVANGHILFWFAADQAPVTRKVNDTTLTFRVSTESPSAVTYDVRGDEVTIIGLPTSGLDNTYKVEVTSKRNKVSTSLDSGEYRVTNTPVSPELSYGGHPVDKVIRSIDKQDLRGNYRSLTFDINTPALSDGITYLWMRAIIDNDADYDDYNQIKAQIDLDGALSSILGETAFPGTKDEILDPDVAHYDVASGEIVFGTSAGNRQYPLGPTDGGIYYCIVINELNNHKAASVSPFFRVS